MRIQASFALMRLLRSPERPPELAGIVRSLLINPRPEWARLLADEPNRYELPVGSYWLTWQIEESTGETVIRATILEE
jgi:hypothetical protein